METDTEIDKLLKLINEILRNTNALNISTKTATPHIY